MKKKKCWVKNMILVIYLLKTIDLSNRRKKLKKSQPEERIAEKVKLRRQKIMIRNSTDENNDDFIDIPDMPPLEGNEEDVKVGKGLKMLTPKKLFTRLPILLAQIKPGNSS